jgi:hypothetical protein
MAVNRIENELEHDRIPLCVGGDESTGSFRDDFKIRENGFARDALPARTHSRRPKHRPDIGTAVPAGLTGEFRFEIRQPNVVRPGGGVDRYRKGAFVVAAVDEQPARA